MATPRRPASIAPLEIRDFTPGIADNPGVGWPAGQATRDNTFRCTANRAGALVPGPRRNYALTGTDFGTPLAGYYVIDGVFAAGPVEGTGTPDPDGRGHDLFVATEFNSGGNRRFKLERWRQYETPVTADLIRDYVTADASNGGNGCGIQWALTRVNRAAPTTPGIPAVIYAWIPALATIGNGFIEQFPNDATPALNAVFQIATPRGMIMNTHQGRVVWGVQNGYSHGVNSSWATAEDLFWTAVNNTGSVGPVQVFVPENPDGYLVLIPMSANELFCLKRSFGVALVGDLDNPTVINLPMVPGGSDPIGATISPLGLVYANRYTGVWLWAHGDSANLLSPAMDPDFWTLAALNAELLVGNKYTFDSFGTRIFLSNNFYFDTDTKGWWRLENPATLQIRHFTHFEQFLYGSPSTTPDPPGTVVYGWNTELGESTYSWQSQPFWETVDSTVNIREIEVVAKGAGTITITASGLGAATANIVLTLANLGYPERFRENFAILTDYLQVKIEANSGSSVVDAPTVYEVILHPDARTPVPTH